MLTIPTRRNQKKKTKEKRQSLTKEFKMSEKRQVRQK